MRSALRFALMLLPAVPALIAAGCASGDDDTVPIAVVGNTDSLFESGGRLSTGGKLVRGAMFEGLTGFDEQGRVIPALADRWIITDDGLSYIFRLRDGTWTDGSPLTAVSAQAALRRALTDIRDTPLGADLSAISEVRAMAGRVIELRLAYRHPDLLQLLAQPELGLVHRGVGGGPMSLVRDGDLAVLRPIPPGQRGLPKEDGWKERARTLRIAALPAEQAVEDLRGGKISLVMGGSGTDFPLASRVGIAHGVVRIDPVSGLFGFVVLHRAGFLADSANREAVAMAIDRDAIARALDVRGWTPSARIVSSGMEGDLGTIGERWTQLDLDERRATAAARVTHWRNAGKPVPVLRIGLPKGPGADAIFAQLQEDLQFIGIDARRVAESADAELRLVDTVARYPRASWFLSQLACSLRRGLCSEEADRLAAEARRAPDGASRAALLAEAEAELTAANVFISLGPPVRWSAMRRDVTGFSVNRWGVHPLMPLAMLPK
jgi:peptide/nickel transport system substrate-binding protein/oligopeptide transport system substrate-binding protein